MMANIERFPAHAGIRRDEDEFDRLSILEKKNALLEETNRQLRLDLRRLERLVYIDSLTGLWNRRFFDASVVAELRRAAREGRPLTLLICDIDHFKRYNDRHGHIVGDTVLTEVARILERACRRGGDLSMRYAGDEFALLLPDVDLEQARILAASLLSAVEQSTALADIHDSMTISIGGSVFHRREACEAAQFVDSADGALYRAKRAGRNRAELETFDCKAHRG
jgi:diguanylate cyclase (GGDEF)-like protein